MKKRILACVLTAVMSAALLMGCGSKKDIDLSSLSATDFDGNEVTSDIFKDYDVTMVNVWATDCVHCIEEMPDIETMYEGLDSNVNIIGICMDGTENGDLARSQIEETGVTYTIIPANDQLTSIIKSGSISVYPMTFFVDSNGNKITAVDTILGTPGEDIVGGYTEKLQAALTAIGK